MFNLRYISFEEDTSYEYLIKTATNKPKKNMDKIFPHYNTLSIQVNDYINKVPTIETIVPLSNTIPKYTIDNIHETLYYLYDSKSDKVKKIKSDIKDLTIKNPLTKNGLVCPYCGISRQSLHDLDHFMPRSKYPEFSILTYNLIFICETCNQDFKKSEFLDTNKHRMFLNPYFDQELSTLQILDCDIEVDDTLLVIEFKVNEDIQNTHGYLYTIADNHLNTLNLADRYEHLVRNDLLDKFFVRFKNIDNKNQRQINILDIKECQSYINERIIELSESSINNFELIFWKKLYDCTDWFKNISGKIL
ncbi:HNH endonuclease [Arcobacter arenosus]|uniref:HNH endonuclease n=1 Tax=Arcobacter arenosus TaxID=2576037 RepID=A0A5R8XXZ4_9BACT|nr:hypothetical protein [Arcobacter arenosus]TLP35492.1 hypothetical protein FDK22_14670 [Arcobacter arenosus]